MEPALHVAPVAAEDLADLLPLMRAYCTFYEAAPVDEDLLAMSRAFLADGGAGSQLIARDGDGRPVGHATLLWSWDTTEGRPLAVMEDLFVVPGARGSGVGRALIDACRAAAAARGGQWLQWQTAPDNQVAQRLYDGLGAERSSWYTYRLSVS